jgi:hypothetical protein
MNTYTVEFRIYGENLQHALITEELSIQPSMTRVKGERRSSNSVFEHGMWGYDGLKEKGEMEWKSLDDGFRFLLGKLMPLKNKIEKYKEHYQIVFWCGAFQDNFSHFSLSPQVLKDLGDFGVEVQISVYFSSENQNAQG